MIAALTPEPSREAALLAESAERELARFDAELGERIATFAPVLLRSEAASSSQIENLTASARAIFSAELGAIAHAQFETIHPFSDGNGRTGRALAQSLLRFRGVTRNVAVPVSAGLLADIEGYRHALTAYRRGDIDPIIEAFANASIRAINNARKLVADIDAIRGSWNVRLAARRSSNAWRLLDILTHRPVLDSATVAAELGGQRPNAYPPLRALVDAGIVKSKAEHRLGPFWRSDEILAAIDAFARRAGRREAV